MKVLLLFLMLLIPVGCSNETEKKVSDYNKEIVLESEHLKVYIADNDLNHSVKLEAQESVNDYTYLEGAFNTTIAYDVQVTREDKNAIFTGIARVSLLIPSKFSNYNNLRLFLVRNDKIIEGYAITIDEIDGDVYASFQTANFGTFVLAQVDPSIELEFDRKRNEAAISNENNIPQKEGNIVNTNPSVPSFEGGTVHTIPDSNEPMPDSDSSGSSTAAQVRVPVYVYAINVDEQAKIPAFDTFYHLFEVTDAPSEVNAIVDFRECQIGISCSVKYEYQIISGRPITPLPDIFLEYTLEAARTA